MRLAFFALIVTLLQGAIAVAVAEIFTLFGFDFTHFLIGALGGCLFLAVFREMGARSAQG